MRVARSLPSFRSGGPAALSTWILTIARRAALTPRRPRPSTSLSSLPAAREPGVAPPPVELPALRRRLEDALDALLARAARGVRAARAQPTFV